MLGQGCHAFCAPFASSWQFHCPLGIAAKSHTSLQFHNMQSPSPATAHYFTRLRVAGGCSRYSVCKPRKRPGQQNTKSGLPRAGLANRLRSSAYFLQAPRLHSWRRVAFKLQHPFTIKVRKAQGCFSCLFTSNNYLWLIVLGALIRPKPRTFIPEKPPGNF